MTTYNPTNPTRKPIPEMTARRRTEQRRKALTFLLANLFAIVTLLAAAGPLAAQDELSLAGKTRSNEAIVRCDPGTLHAFVGTTVSVTIYVQDVVDLYGLDVRLMFDPAYVQAVDTDPATAGVQIQPLSGFLSPDFVVRRSADNTTGLVRYAATQVAPSQPVSGSGAVARIDLRAVQPGAITVPFPQVELARNDGSNIPATTQACTWQFSQPRPIFLPLVTIR